MIKDLSLSLRQLLTQAGPVSVDSAPPLLSNADIVFDRPTDSFNPARPTLSLYLYDVRENTELRSNETFVDWHNGQAVLNRAPIRVNCTYLVTAWPGSGSTGDDLALGEHHLLSQALLVFSRSHTLPPASLVGSLIGQQPALPLITARAEGLPNPSEFWTSLANKLRPSLTVTVTIAMSIETPITAPPVVSSELLIKRDAVIDSDQFLIAGRVTDSKNAALPGAVVTLSSSGVSTITDADGRYRLDSLAAGSHSLRVQAKAMKKDLTIEVPAAAANGYDVQLS